MTATPITAQSQRSPTLTDFAAALANPRRSGSFIIQSVIGLVPALALWRWPSVPVWGWIVVIAFCGTYSHYCLTRVMLHADATIVVPMDFLRVPLAALTGWLVYTERIDLLTAVGAALILGGNLLNLRGAGQAGPKRNPS